jgi:hypothetical protein
MEDPTLLKLSKEGGEDYEHDESKAAGDDALDGTGAPNDDNDDDDDDDDDDDASNEEDEDDDDDVLGGNGGAVDSEDEDDVAVFARVNIHGIPLDRKVRYARADYEASKCWELSSSLEALVSGSDALVAELRAHPNHCDFKFIEYLCYLDRKFAGDVCEDAMLRVALRNLQGADASQLYNDPLVIDEDRKVLNPVVMKRNVMGQSLLRWVSSAFDNRGTLIRLRLRFLEIVFHHLVQDIDLFMGHEVELKNLARLLQNEMEVFYKQLPMVRPKVGDFTWHRMELETSREGLRTLLQHLAAASTEAAEVKAAEAEDVQGRVLEEIKGLMATTVAEIQDLKGLVREGFKGPRTLAVERRVAATAAEAETEAHGPADRGLFLGEGAPPKSANEANEEDQEPDDAKVAASVAGAANHDDATATGRKRKSSSLDRSPDDGQSRARVPKTDRAAFAKEEDDGLDAMPPASAKLREGAGESLAQVGPITNAVDAAHAEDGARATGVPEMEGSDRGIVPGGRV